MEPVKSAPDGLIARPPEEEFEDFVRLQIKILTRLGESDQIDSHLKALELGKQLLKEQK